MKAGSKPGVRTIGVTPPPSAAITIACTSWRSKVVCSMSINAASNPARPNQLDDLRVGDAADMRPERKPALAEDLLDAVLLHHSSPLTPSPSRSAAPSRGEGLVLFPQPVVCLRMNCFIRSIAGAAYGASGLPVIKP